jgi:low affinity Fe/Cu permease
MTATGSKGHLFNIRSIDIIQAKLQEDIRSLEETMSSNLSYSSLKMYNIREVA